MDEGPGFVRMCLVYGLNNVNGSVLKTPKHCATVLDPSVCVLVLALLTVFVHPSERLSRARRVKRVSTFLKNSKPS